MYLVRDPIDNTYVFCDEDPEIGGFEGPVVGQVVLDRPPATEGWSPGEPIAELYLGQSPADERHFRIFLSSRECSYAKFEPLGESFRVVRTWPQYLAERHARAEPLRYL